MNRDELNQQENSDRELWREREGDYYSDKIFITQSGGIGIDCAGRCVVKPIREWFGLAWPTKAPEPVNQQLLDALKELLFQASIRTSTSTQWQKCPLSTAMNCARGAISAAEKQQQEQVHES